MSVFSLRRCVLLVAVLAGLTWTSPSANASLQLVLDGTLVDTAPSGTFVTYSSILDGPVNGFFISLTAGTSNSPGAPPQSELTVTTLSIRNDNASTATIEILVGETDYTFPPTGPASLAAGIGGSVTQTNAANEVEYEVWVNDNNVQNDMSPGIDSGPIIVDLSGVPNGGSWNLANIVSGLVSANPFSMTSRILVTLGAGGQIGFQATAVLTNVPEPGTFGMAFAGLALVGVGGIARLRRRQA